MTAQEEYKIEEQYIRMHTKKIATIANGISYCCLYHSDDKPSASHVLKNGKVLDYCSVCGKIHDQIKKDSGVWKESQPRQIYSKFEKFLYYNMSAEYRYCDFKTEKYLYSVFRMKDKNKGFPVGIRDGEHISSGTNGIDVSMAVFTDDIKRLKQMISDGKTVIYTEGEKDCLTIIKNGYVGFTCGGCNKFKEALLPNLKGGKFIVFGDNDTAGIADARRITTLLNSVSTATMIIPPEVPEKGDISDYMQTHSKDDLQKLINSAMNNTVKEKSIETARAPDEQIDLAQFHIIGSNGKETVYHNAIFEYIKKHYDLFVYGKTPYIYSGGYFVADISGARLKSIIRGLIRPHLIRSTTINNIYDLFLQDIGIEVEFAQLNCYPPYWICFKNGMWDCREKRLLPHNPKYRCINQVPFDYKPEAEFSGEHIEEYLHFICEKPDDREMLLQFIGYSLTKDTSQQKFLVLNGRGGTGKSTVIRLVEALVGNRNVSNISLTDLQQRFASFGLMAKLANTCADLEISALEDVSLVKKILGEDTLRAEQKGRDAISFKSYAKLIFSTNELPLVKSEKTNGFYRRLLVLTMNKIPENKNPNLFNELASEIDYLLQLAVKAAERMYEQGVITVSEASEKAVLQLWSDSDTVQAFLNDLCTNDDGERVERTELYVKYADYCDDTDRQSLTKNNFYKSLRVKGYYEVKVKGCRYFRGISFQKDALNVPPKMPPNDFISVSQEQMDEIPFQ